MAESNYFSQSRLLWKPTHPEWTSVEAFRRHINLKHGLKLENYYDLHRYSVEDYTFWLDLWDYLGILSSVPPNPARIIEEKKLPEVANWFPDARLNYAENLLRRRDDGIAFTEVIENAHIKHYTFRHLYNRVQEIASALRANGLKVGDRVAAIVSNSVNTIAVALAVASIGGIYSSTATDMGAQGILDRYKQITPKFIFADSETQFAGQPVNVLPKIKEIASKLQEYGLQHTVLLPSRLSGKDLRFEGVPNVWTLTDFIKSGGNKPLVFEQLPFNTPLYILYSSGTSGPPKCIVHSAGGVLLQTLKEVVIAFDSTPNDVYFQFTTTGWMLWNLMVSALAIGPRTLLYEGSPFYPDLPSYLRLIDQQGVSILGSSPRLLAEIQGRGINPLDIGSFSALRLLGSTGAVLTPPMYEWSHKAFGGKTHLVSISGGTDICSGFTSGAPSLPVYSGEMQVKSLGMKVEVFDPAGNNVEHLGQAGELVCTRPHPSQPLFFWGDKGGKKFMDAYFNTYPGVWRQGDFMVINPKTKGLIILGRSDGVLNPSGVRFGSAEIYSLLEPFSKQIEDSICVGQRRPQDNDERVILFLKIRKGHKLTPELVSQIRATIRSGLSPRHVPAYILEIPEIPYTINGKKIEIAVKQIISGSTLKPSGTVANPDSLKLYYKFVDIEKVAGAPKAKL